MQGARLVNKGGKIEHEKKFIVPERKENKEIRADFVLTPRLFSHSSLSSTLSLRVFFTSKIKQASLYAFS